ncbi:MAG: hypothetical protein EOO61_18435 [Hymenobacter sp.]|nr:MAG: hypothetical protein EOO61_18435 [Hymenobacter sp.]
MKHLKEGMYPARATYLDKDLSPLDALDCYSGVWVDVEKSGKYSIVLPEHSVPGSATRDPETKEILREIPLAKHFTIAGCDTSVYDIDLTDNNPE